MMVVTESFFPIDEEIFRVDRQEPANTTNTNTAIIYFIR
jgi:hypothetical protein